MKWGVKNLIIAIMMIFTCQSGFCYVLNPSSLNNILSSKIKSEVKSQVQKYSSDFDIKIFGIPSEKIVTNENTIPKIEIINPTNNFQNNSIRKVTIKNSKNEIIKTFTLNVQTNVYKKVLIATSNIQYNQEINSSNSAIERVDITRNLDNYIDYNLENSVAKRNIIKNSIITSNYVKQKALVNKNSVVDIRFLSKGLEIRLQGIALKDGAKGETILVKSDKYNKTYNAQVESSTDVVVRI